MAKTTTIEGHAYPAASSGAVTFYCELADANFWPAQAGPHVGQSFLAKDPQVLVLASSRHGLYFPEGTVVEIDQFNGQWWIDRFTYQPVYGAAFRVSLVPIASGQIIQPLVDIYRDPKSSGQPTGVTFGANGLDFSQSGSYLVGFSLSLWSNDAPRGGLLAVGLFVGKESDPLDQHEATQYQAVRSQDIEVDQYGANILTTLENVACAGPLQIKAGQTLTLRNTCAYTIFATPCNLWACQVMEHDVTTASQNLT